jgi:hypothetical protein
MTQVNDCPEAAGVTKATAVYAEPQSELPSTQEFDNQAQLFTDDAEKSWVEFRAARGKDNYNLDLFRDGSEVPEKGTPLQSCDTSSIITRPEKTRQLPQRTDDYSGETLRDYSKVLEKEFPWRSCDASGILTEPQEIRLLPNIRVRLLFGISCIYTLANTPNLRIRILFMRCKFKCLSHPMAYC